MAGGAREAVAPIEPILRRLAAEGGYVHAGPAGAGHFAKLVQNGIAYGMFQAVAEGVELLERFDGGLDVAGILDGWRGGAVVRSWILDKLADAYRSEGGTAHVPPYVEDTGEVNWLVNDALEMDVAAPVISQALLQVIASRDEQKRAARVVAMLRRGIGGHPYGRDDESAERRRRSRSESCPP
jgi:6-phosphogluconate dehydrogenase